MPGPLAEIVSIHRPVRRDLLPNLCRTYALVDQLLGVVPE